MQPKILLMIAALASALLLAPLSFGLGTDSPLAAAATDSPSAQAQWGAADAAVAPADAQSVGLEQAVPEPVTPAAALLGVAQQLNDAKQQQLLLVQMRQQLAAAEASNRWLPWLVLALLGLLGLSGWLAVQLRLLQHQQAVQARHASAVAQALAEAEADVHSDTQALASGGTPLFSAHAPLLSGSLTGPRSVQAALATGPAAGEFRSSTPAASAVSLVPISEAARPAKSLSFASGIPPRPVSVEELLDLEQQVDFFIVLGQEQAAVELLLSHVRTTGGASALPYFKLLQIYRRQGDEEAYERTRDRFNQRFNAQAPDWRGDLAAGRCLEHYPEVVTRLQQAWLQPLQALVELESLLLRRADLEAFDLPAFHDILTLHALVSDLPAIQASPPAVASVPAALASVPAALAVLGPAVHADVDLLLPLDDGPTEITLPRPRMAEPGELARAMLADWVFSRASQRLPTDGAEVRGQSPAAAASTSTVKLDIDLTGFGPAPREFTRTAAFADVDVRRDSRLSDLAAFEDSDLRLPSTTRR